MMILCNIELKFNFKYFKKLFFKQILLTYWVLAGAANKALLMPLPCLILHLFHTLTFSKSFNQNENCRNLNKILHICRGNFKINIKTDHI